jgi:hypothetical protein
MNPGAVTKETLALAKAALAGPGTPIQKSYSQATGLVAYDLQAPSKNLYPVNTPIRNRIPRVGGGIGTATNWKVIQAIIGSGFDGMGFVPEGQRSGRMSVTEADKAATYRTIGEEDQVSFEAESAGRTFEDVRASAAMRLLQKMMLKEEVAILGANASLALGTTPTPTLSAGGTGATLPALTYSVIVVALSYEGWRNFRNTPIATGLTQSQVITGADGLTYTLNGGAAQKSAAATQAITLGQVLSCTVAPVRGAVAYAWYTGAAGSEKLETITTLNSTTFSAPLAGTGQAASALTSADNSRNSALAFDGLLTNVFTVANGAYFSQQATGVAGTGTVLTSSGRGSVNEIDNMLYTMWNTAQVSPTVLFVNAQELKNITTKCLTGASGPLLQFFADPSRGAQVLAAGGGIEFYFNPFSTGGGIKIPVLIHPDLPPGTIAAWCENLPAQYQSNNVPNVAEVKTRRDYYQIDWPLRTRQYETGVYAEEVLAVYAPFAMGVIANVPNG